MNKNYDLELNILSCLLQRPDLMKENKLKDDYFKKYKKLWIFMRIFYDRFKTFDLVLMTTMAKNKLQMSLYLQQIVDVEPAPSLFKEYQETLIMLYYEEQKDKEMIEKIFELSNELMIRKINLEEFEEKYEKLKEKRGKKND